MRPLFRAVAGGAGVCLVAAGGIAWLAASSGCGGSGEACTPESEGLGAAKRLAVDFLGATEALPGDCTSPRLEFVSSDAALLAVLDGLSDGGTPGVTPDGGPFPPIDFARSRVLVRTGTADVAVSWAVADGTTCVVGLLGCGTVGNAPSCVTSLHVVDATDLTSITTRTCTGVGCAQPFGVFARSARGAASSLDVSSPVEQDSRL